MKNRTDPQDIRLSQPEHVVSGTFDTPQIENTLPGTFAASKNTPVEGGTKGKTSIFVHCPTKNTFKIHTISVL